MSGARIESRIVPEAGCRSAEVALKLAEIADLHAQLGRVASGLTAAQLGWQPAPGRNTIGMLLAHIAVAQVHLGFVVLKGERDSDISGVLGITMDDDGMPLPADGLPPAALEGREVTFFTALLERALEHTRLVARGLDDASLTVSIERPPRPDGSVRVFDRRWGLYHLVEHAAQHLGQIQVLKASALTARPS
ncbi:MAG: DinB family protein [Candidatus Eisenbacteria bacterium]|nr:DinB family protein [Candidatus Eisenbacteria bacterium]